MFRNIILEINRDSVCMGDDCESHKKSIKIKRNTKMSELLVILQDYVPAMKNVVWAIRSSDGIQGYIITDSNAKSEIEVYGGDTQVLKRISKKEIICKYYYPSKFSRIDGNTGKRIDQYVECSTFLQKVKKDNEPICINCESIGLKFPLNNSSHMEAFKDYKLVYETLRSATQLNILEFIAGDCPLHDIENHMALEDLYTMCHYFKCNKCGRIFFIGFCCRGMPIGKIVYELPTNIEQISNGHYGTYYAK